MLPLHSHENVHHRHSLLGSLPSVLGVGGSSGAFNALHSHKHGNTAVKRLLRTGLQVLLTACVLLPLVYIWAESGSPSQNSRSATEILVNRKMGLKTKKEPDITERPADLIPAAQLKNLIIVAGHAVYVGKDFSKAGKESSWFLEDYQKVPGEANSFLEHIKMGIEAAASDPSALLLFSGGQTRREAGPRSEGLSYWIVAEAAGWFGQRGVRNRTFTEEHARDSLENLMFSLCRFYELTGHYPEHVTVVSYSLKQARFQSLHREAVRWPMSHFHFLGNEIPPAAKGAKEGEQRTVAAFMEEPYGCTGSLREKRLHRDPFAVGPPHPSRCPAMAGLLQHCARDLYQESLPWLEGLA